MFRPLVACFFVVAFGQFLEVQARLKAAVEEVSDLLDSAKKDLKEKYEHADEEVAELQEVANVNLPQLNNLWKRMAKRAAGQEMQQPDSQE
ncbi:uncharacterized protein LOC120300087 isoform X3 [Crotalus tigris]|uniref:uncharacterized protein LOC120300087 isoform X3 n=1 Tax=Crotalus tigris TaxID=88082 RepID=UPI00192F3449|nr:uncharacterized protein LOC120300087 isoform X3 [Crotalus tigris]